MSETQADIQVRHFFKREQRYDGNMQFGFGYGFNNVAVGASTPVEERPRNTNWLFSLWIRQQRGGSHSRDRLHDEMTSERRQAHIGAVKEMFERF